MDLLIENIGEKQRFCVPVFIGTLLLLLCAVPGIAEVGIKLEVNKDVVLPGDKIVCRGGITGSMQNPQPVDIYLALMRQYDPLIYYLTPDLQVTNTKTPIVEDWNPVALDTVDVFSFTLNETSLKGEYYWAGVLTYADKDPFTDGSILPGAESLAIVPFQFTAADAGIVYWSPQENDTFTSNEPEVFLQFSKPVEKTSAEQKIEVQIESLSSGKTVSVEYNAAGERWASAVIPNLGTLSMKLEDNDFLSQAWSKNNTKLTYQVKGFTIYGQTFQLNYGVTYKVTFHLIKGAVFADGTAIPEKTIGPITFSISDLK